MAVVKRSPRVVIERNYPDDYQLCPLSSSARSLRWLPYTIRGILLRGVLFRALRERVLSRSKPIGLDRRVHTFSRDWLSLRGSEDSASARVEYLRRAALLESSSAGSATVV